MAVTREHLPLRRGMLLLSLAIGLGAGFASASVLGFALADVLPIGPWWAAVVQAHGHAQLFGFVALFVFGVGFHFLPRMRGSPLQRPALVPIAQWALGGGVVARFAAQTALALGGGRAWHVLLVLSAISELLAAGAVVVVLVSTLRTGPPIRTRAGVHRTLPFLGIAFSSFVLACAVNAGGVFLAARDGTPALPPIADALAVELLLHGQVVAISLAVGVQTLPLFLRLPPQETAATRIAGALYAISMLLRAAGTATSHSLLHGAGVVLAAVVVIAFVLRIDVVFRVRRPWTAERVPYVLGTRKPMRPGMPDRGEFGRFEWLVRGAFAWLIVACVLEVLGLVCAVSRDASRHAFTMGFAALLIGGMAVRMIPGFADRPLPAPRLVSVLALLGHAAAASRVAPLLVAGGSAGHIALAASGLLAWSFLLVLALLLVPILRAPSGVAQRPGGAERSQQVASREEEA